MAVKPNFSNFLGKKVHEEDEDASLEDTRHDLFNTLIRTYGETRRSRHDLARELRAIETDNELLDFIERYFHIRIPTTTPVEGHTSLAEAFCDAYFERVPIALWWASRASGKSYMAGLMAVLNTLRYDRCETTILAGSEQQGRQVYQAAESHVHMGSLVDYIDMKKTYATADNGSNFRVLTASPKSARGPHPQRLFLDEVDEIPEDVFIAAINQPMTKHGVEKQTLLTSTMHKVFGLMARLIDEQDKNGIHVYKWNYKAVTEQCVEPDCRNLTFSDRFRGEPCPLLGRHIDSLIHLSDDDRAYIRPAREYVTEDGYDDNGELVSGYYDGSCQGDLRRSDGFVPLDDQRIARLQVPTKTWETENECRRPSQEDMVYDPRFIEKGTVSEIPWDFELSEDMNWGMVDWGFNNPTAFLIAQERVVEGRELTMYPRHRVLIREWYWEQRGLNWRIEQIVDIALQYRLRQIYADAENLDALHALREALQAVGWTALVRGVPFNRFKNTLIDNIRNDMENGHWIISERGCPNTLRDLYRLHYRPNTELVAKENDHGPDAMIAGWRRFLALGEYSTRGDSLGSVGRIHDLMGMGPGVARKGGGMLPPGREHVKKPVSDVVLPSTSPVGVSFKGKGPRNGRGRGAR